ncbi:MAG: roadblock/LC7 domain-containing protein [Promethearchaeota archaeon]
MKLKEKINLYLEQIKALKGVENIILTQRDGNPIQSTGIWFSREEIFSVSSATSAIYNVGLHLYPRNLKYILIEGKKAKILIAPLDDSRSTSIDRIFENREQQNYEFFIAIMAHPKVNLGGIFLQTAECLKKIKTALLTSQQTFRPPLIEFDENKLWEIISGFNVKEEENFMEPVNSISLNFSASSIRDLKKVLKSFAITVPDLKFAFVSIEGGFIASELYKKINKQEINIDTISGMSYSLFSTADRCTWILKKMSVENILIDCKNSFQFINRVKNGIFSAEIGKTGQKLGLLRLILPQFSYKINEIFESISRENEQETINIKSLLGNLVIK